MSFGNEDTPVFGSGNQQLLERPTFVESQAKGEVDTQIATAKRFPRSVKKFKEDALTLATLDIETAASCFYSVPRDGKNIEGPSARLAEIIAASWGNLRSQANIIDEDDRFITARGMCWDLEKNVAVSTEVRRRITNKQGRKFSDDMVNTTANAACSIALRNAVFKVVPMALAKSVYDAARKVAIGDASTLVKRRTDMVNYFGKMGVSPEQICAAVSRASVDDITVDDLATLLGLSTAIKEGDTTVDDAFPPLTKPKTDDKPKTQTDALAEELAGKGKASPTTHESSEQSGVGTPNTLQSLTALVGSAKRISDIHVIEADGKKCLTPDEFEMLKVATELRKQEISANRSGG